MCELTKPTQCLLVPYDDEVPGLAIPSTGRQTARFDNVPDDGFRDRGIFEVRTANTVRIASNVSL